MLIDGYISFQDDVELRHVAFGHDGTQREQLVLRLLVVQVDATAMWLVSQENEVFWKAMVFSNGLCYVSKGIVALGVSDSHGASAVVNFDERAIVFVADNSARKNKVST